VPEATVGARARGSRLAGLEYVSPGVPACGPLKPLAVLVVAPRVHLANSFALDVALAPLNELDDDVMVFQYEVGCCVVATLNPPVKAPAVLRQLPLERAGRAPALATSPRAGVLVGAFLRLSIRLVSASSAKQRSSSSSTAPSRRTP